MFGRYFKSCDIGNSAFFQVYLESHLGMLTITNLWNWDFGGHLVEHSVMSQDVLRLLEICGSSILVVMSCRTSHDIQSSPRTCWDLWT